MDSQWFHQATASNGGFNDKNNAGNMVDLNLKLGLANHDDTNHQINLSHLFNKPVPITTPSLANFTFNGPNTSDKEINPRPTNGAGKHVGHLGTICNENGIALNTKGLGNRKRNAAGNEIGMMVGGLPFHGGQVHFISSTQEIGNLSHSIKINNNVMDSAAQNTSSMLRAGGYTNLLSNFNTNLLPPATLKNYTLLDFSSKDAEIGSSYRSPRRYLNRRREVCYNDPGKTCYNIHCRTNNTPMWRRGPLGARTLCNACGIRHRKEQDRKRAREEAANRQNGN